MTTTHTGRPLWRRTWARVALAGCGSSSPASPAAPEGGPDPVATAPAQAGRPLNPVTILKDAGFTPDPGEVYGTSVINDVSAGSTIKDAAGNELEYVDVYTSATDANFQEEQGTDQPSDDLGIVTIPAKKAVILIQTYTPGPAQTAQQIAAQVGQRVHGLVIEPQA